MKSAWLDAENQSISSSTKIEVCLRMPPTRGHKACAYLSEAMKKGNIYIWQICFRGPGNPSVGVTTPKMFGEGTFPIGLFYKGSLSDGRRGLKPDFGKPIVDEDVVSLFVDITKDHLKIGIVHNDVPLGTAYSLQNYATPLHLVVSSTTGPCSFQVKPQTLISFEDFNRPRSESTGVIGHWSYIPHSSSEWSLFGWKRASKKAPSVTLSIRRETEDMLSLSLDTGVFTSQYLLKQLKNSHYSCERSKSINMLPTKKLPPTETAIIAAVSGDMKMCLLENGNLVISTAHSTSLLEFSRLLSRSPVTSVTSFCTI